MPSITATDSIEISASPQTVFGVIADYSNIHTWHLGYKCDVLDTGSIKEGSKVAHRVGNMVKFTRRIDSITPNERLEESYISGDLRGKGVWTFDATDTGTLATFECNVASKAWLPHIGFLLTGSKGHKDAYKKLLNDLKKHCELI